MLFRDFSRFEVEDFAFDESFQKWVTGNESESNDFWNKYADENPHQIDKILAARELVHQLVMPDKTPVPEEMAADIWGRINAGIRKPLYQYWSRAAVVALLIAGCSGYLWYKIQPVKTGEISATTAEETVELQPSAELVNLDVSPKEFVLPDGSRASLGKTSRIRFVENFNQKERAIQLHGEAFFDIVPDSKRPFVIYANNTVVKVLGTSFRIQAHDKASKVVVSVRSGKVSVFERQDYEKDQGKSQISGIVLTANQEAEYSNKLHRFSKMIVPDPVILDDTDTKEFDFDSTPLPDVFSTLERAYGIEIIYDKKLLAERLLKVSLEDETLIEKLDVICMTMGLSYHTVDARIIIENR